MSAVGNEDSIACGTAFNLASYPMAGLSGQVLGAAINGGGRAAPCYGGGYYRVMAEKEFWGTPTLAVYTPTLEHGIRDYETDDRKRHFSAGIWRTWDPRVGFRKPPDARALAVRTAAVRRWEEAGLAAFKSGVQRPHDAGMVGA